MKVTQKELDDGVLMVTLDGSIDLPAAMELDDAFKALPDTTERLVVDINDVSFLASIGIRVLVMKAKAIAEAGGRMAVYGAQELPQRVLKSTGTDIIVNLVEDEASAISAVSP